MMGPIRYAAQRARGMDDGQRGEQSHNFAIRNNIADVRGFAEERPASERSVRMCDNYSVFRLHHSHKVFIELFSGYDLWMS
jgi:hypothetical protein